VLRSKRLLLSSQVNKNYYIAFFTLCLNLYPIHAGNFKLDGGAMFGVVPKSIWQRSNPADKDNLIDLCARCLLIENGSRLILIDTGMGDKQSERFFSYYRPWGNHNLIDSIKQAGFHPNDITDVFLTHKCVKSQDGSFAWNKDLGNCGMTSEEPEDDSNQSHWDWATKPNPREKASFLKNNLKPIEDSGRLIFIEKGTINPLGFDLLFVDGHTEKQMLPMIDFKREKVIFMGDLIPTVGNIPVPYVMGYDVRPLISLEEKASFLKIAADNNYLLFMEHDAHSPLVRVQHTEKGVRLKSRHEWKEIF
jgi:glyoxylase-like metal-dependent hydrolase (beta-lactamase superfamily II)